jgi:uracil-DNA glycosylase family 4
MDNETLWSDYINTTSNCKLCHNDNLLDKKAFPLFIKNTPVKTDLLFVLEAPNRDDTYNAMKGYITTEDDTDPSGAFFNELFTKVLCRNISDVFLTNAVLCLPNKNKYGKYSVTSKIGRNCKKNIVQIIDIFQPKVICTLGTKALDILKLIESHNITTLKGNVAIPVNWYNRILFPLYHTGLLARKPPNGRSKELQKKDWEKLREILN